MNRLLRLAEERVALTERIATVRRESTTDPGAKLAGLDGLLAQLEGLDNEMHGEAVRREAVRNEPAISGTFDAVSFHGGPSGRASIAVGGDPRDPGAARSPLFADVFGAPAPARAEGWTGLNEFFEVVSSGRHDPRLASATSMGSTVGSDGGFLVPTQYSAEMLDAALENEIVRPRARIYPITQGDTRKIASFDGGDHASSLFGGFSSVWMAESETATPQKAKTRLMTLRAQKLAIFANASSELVADGMTYQDLLGSAMKATIGFDLDVAFLSGSGAGKPLGVFNDPALLTIAKETGQAADSILVENLDKLFARMHPAGRTRGVWVANSDTIPQLLSLVRIAGTGGVPVPVMTEGPDGFRILTRPVIFTEKVPTLGDAHDISFVDFSQYAIGMRKEAVLDRSNAPGWFEDEQSYRMILRVDGRGRWAAPITPRNGASLSWAVTLGERA